MKGTWFEGYKVSDQEPSDRAVEIMESYLTRRDGSKLDFITINCASGTDYANAIELWYALPAHRGTSRNFRWEKRSVDTLRNLYLWRSDGTEE